MEQVFSKIMQVNVFLPSDPNDDPVASCAMGFFYECSPKRIISCTVVLEMNGKGFSHGVFVDDFLSNRSTDINFAYCRGDFAEEISL